jgi:hypothetical protein
MKQKQNALNLRKRQQEGKRDGGLLTFLASSLGYRNQEHLWVERNGKRLKG